MLTGEQLVQYICERAEGLDLIAITEAEGQRLVDHLLTWEFSRPVTRERILSDLLTGSMTIAGVKIRIGVIC